jgi:MFS family permease
VVCLHDVAGASVGAAGAALSVAMAGGIIGRIGWGVVADRFIAPRHMLGLLGIGMSLAAFAVPVLDSGWPWVVVLVFSFVFGATAVGWNGVYLSQVALVAPPGRAAEATGASLAMTYLGVVVTPLIIWTINALGFGYGAGFVVVGLLSLWRGSVFFRR